jgi:hypothetical protein
MNRESCQTPTAVSHDSEIVTGSILPIDFFRDNIPVTRYFKLAKKSGKLIPSTGGDSINLDNIHEKHDFFEIGRVNSSVKQLIQKELIEPAIKNLDALISSFKEKSNDIHFLNGICRADPLRNKFLNSLEEIYNDHLTLLNLKKLNDASSELLEESLDICSLATILALRSNFSSQEINTICKGALLINIGRTQVPSHEHAKHIDEGCKYLTTLGYNETIVNIVRFKSSFENTTPEPRLVIGVVKASYLYHLSLNKYRPDSIIGAYNPHDATLTKLKTYVTLKYLNPRIYRLLVRVFNESKLQAN